MIPFKTFRIAARSWLALIAAGLLVVGGAAAHAGASAEPEGLTEEQFNDTLGYIQARYDSTQVLDTHSDSFTIIKEWEDGTKNSGTYKRGRKWAIRIPGGAARVPSMTEDALTLYACHNIGNLTAGFPLSKRDGKVTRVNAMSTSFNNSYYATFVCTNNLWGHKYEENAKSREVVDAESKVFCDSIFPDPYDQNLCYRKVLAARVFVDVFSRGKKVSTETPDETIVDKTRGGGKQCRFDTLLAGAACPKYNEWDHGEYPLTEKEMAQQTCAAKEADYPYDSADVIKAGLRPFCWFKPGL